MLFFRTDNTNELFPLWAQGKGVINYLHSFNSSLKSLRKLCCNFIFNWKFFDGASSLCFQLIFRWTFSLGLYVNVASIEKLYHHAYFRLWAASWTPPKRIEKLSGQHRIESSPKIKSVEWNRVNGGHFPFFHQLKGAFRCGVLMTRNWIREFCIKS